MIDAEAFLRANPVSIRRNEDDEPSEPVVRIPRGGFGSTSEFGGAPGRSGASGVPKALGTSKASPSTRTTGTGAMRFGWPAIRYRSVGDSAVDASADDAGTDGVAAVDVATDGVASDDVAVDDGNAEDVCREAALRLLDAAPRSSGALRDRLLGKGFDEAVVERVVERMVDLLLINDHDYAESVVRVCAGRMMGRRGTAMELDRKGVDRALAVQVLDEAERQGVFEDAAWELGRRTARKTQGLDRQVRQRRFWAAGGRKGHNPETLRRVAAELFN